MNYRDKEFTSRGIDSDLCYCLEFNPQGIFSIETIEKVLAVWEGENDGDDWRWILKLKYPIEEKQFVFLQGGCDFTGWDCQSYAVHYLYSSPEEAALSKGEDLILTKDNNPVFGLGRMINMLGGNMYNNLDEVSQSLLAQLKEGKNKTWSEEAIDRLNKDYGINDLSKI